MTEPDVNRDETHHCGAMQEVDSLELLLRERFRELQEARKALLQLAAERDAARAEVERLKPAVVAADPVHDTIMLADFSEFDRAEREGRPVNPKAFARIVGLGPFPKLPPAADIERTCEPTRRWWHRLRRRGVR